MGTEKNQDKQKINGDVIPKKERSILPPPNLMDLKKSLTENSSEK